MTQEMNKKVVIIHHEEEQEASDFRCDSVVHSKILPKS